MFLDNKTILSAAHCTIGASRIAVTMGAHDVSDPSEPSQVTMISNDIISHPDYNPSTIDNDIGMILFREGIPLSPESESNTKF